MSRHLRTGARLLALIALIVAGFQLGPTTADADAADESRLYALTNGERSAAGLPALATSSDLAAAARRHATWMASNNVLSHSDLVASYGGAAAGWTWLGENVGVGSTADEVHALFMASASHRATILSSATVVGIGAVRDSSGRLWVAEAFATISIAPVPAPTITGAEVVADPVVIEAAPAPLPAPVEAAVASASLHQAVPTPSRTRQRVVAPAPAPAVAPSATCAPDGRPDGPPAHAPAGGEPGADHCHPAHAAAPAAAPASARRGR